MPSARKPASQCLPASMLGMVVGVSAFGEISPDSEALAENPHGLASTGFSIPFGNTNVRNYYYYIRSHTSACRQAGSLCIPSR
jgi:hypothetical protein